MQNVCVLFLYRKILDAMPFDGSLMNMRSLFGCALKYSVY